MKKSGFKMVLNTSLMVFMLVSCETFVPDPIDPRLPIYSEIGRNIAGVKVGNQFFNNDIRPLYLFCCASERQYFDENHTQLVLDINVWNQSQNLRFVFELNGLTDEDWDDMEKGFGKKFVFNETNKVTLSELEKEDFVSVPFEGQITVKLLKNEKIVSGTFGFKARDSSDREILVTFGRYDYSYYSF
ncbi:hypothetical protein [Aquiflexum lacus]|uniref:hypothetical protein n=1 Tax=Aquiflexum lacus TaxID=2483805 RepID=UPI0018943398|nr:hypothetical protein [Aquiflexum lacus]